MRKKIDIIHDFALFLREKGAGVDPDKVLKDKAYSLMIEELLMNKLYETEEYKGTRISTVDAFFTFCNFVIKDDLKSKKLVWNRFVRRLFLDVERQRYSCIQASRSAGKSFFLFGLYVPFKTFLWPYFDVLLVSNIPKMGKRNFRVLKGVIEQNQLLLEKKDVKKGKDLKWTEDMIEYNSGIIEVLSLGTSPRSAHVAFIGADDIIRDDNKYSDDYTENYVLAQLLPCVGRLHGRFTVMGTPITHDDILARLSKNKKEEYVEDGVINHNGFYCKWYPAISDKGKLLLDDWFSLYDLEQLKNTMGDRRFNREYLLKCTSNSEAVFPHELIRRCSDFDDAMIEVGELGKNYVVCADIATSGAISADYSAFIVLEVYDVNEKVAAENELGAKYFKEEVVIKKKVVHIHHGKGIEVSEQVIILEDLCKRFNNAPVVVEKNNVGVSIIQELSKRSVNVTEFVTDRFKKINMIRYLKNELINERIVFPGDSYELKKLKNELHDFGIKVRGGTERFEAMSGKDDLVIAFAIGVLHTQNYGVGLAFAVCQD